MAAPVSEPPWREIQLLRVWVSSMYYDTWWPGISLGIKVTDVQEAFRLVAHSTV